LTRPVNQSRLQSERDKAIISLPGRHLSSLSLGGCEPQLKGHIQGNINVGNDKAFLLAVVTQLLPFNGYPRALNAIVCLNEALPETKGTTRRRSPLTLTTPFALRRLARSSLKALPEPTRYSRSRGSALASAS